MDKTNSVIETLEGLQKKYAIETEGLNGIKEKLSDFHLCVPLVGEFSSGKSTFINTLLDNDLDICVVDTTAKTAVPMELYYGEEEFIRVYYKDETIEELSYSEYNDRKNEFVYCNDGEGVTEQARATKLIKMQLNDNVLKEFSGLAIVDLPGLGSTRRDHDDTVYNYIKDSMAYIVVINGEKLAIERELEAAIQNLALYNLPVCAVVTKAGRIVDREVTKTKIRTELLGKYFGNKEIPVFFTEREKATGDREHIIEYLKNLVADSKELCAEYFDKKLQPEATRINNYLYGVLKNMEISFSDLEVKKEQLQQDLSKMNEKIDKELQLLLEEKGKMIENMAGDVQMELDNSISSLAYQCVNNRDVTEEMRRIIQKTLNESWQKNVTERIKKHVQKISDAMSISSVNSAAAISINAEAISGIEINGVARIALDALAFLIGGPFGAVISDLIIKFINGNSEAKREQARENAKRELRLRVFPEVDKEIREKLCLELDNVLMEAKKLIEAEVTAQTDVLNKALEEVTFAKETEDREKENKKMMIEQDIKVLESLGYGVE